MKTTRFYIYDNTLITSKEARIWRRVSEPADKIWIHVFQVKELECRYPALYEVISKWTKIVEFKAFDVTVLPAYSPLLDIDGAKVMIRTLRNFEDYKIKKPLLVVSKELLENHDLLTILTACELRFLYFGWLYKEFDEIGAFCNFDREFFYETNMEIFGDKKDNKAKAYAIIHLAITEHMSIKDCTDIMFKYESDILNKKYEAISKEANRLACFYNDYSQIMYYRDKQ